MPSNDLEKLDRMYADRFLGTERLTAVSVDLIAAYPALAAEIRSLREHAEALAGALGPFAFGEDDEPGISGPYLDANAALDAYRKEYPKE
jgi:hypothetical protein